MGIWHSWNHDEISWVFHPHHGVVSQKGSQIHSLIFREHEYLKVLHVAGEDHEYDPPRGYLRIVPARQALYYTKYITLDIENVVDAEMLDDYIRNHYRIPAVFKSILVGRQLSGWTNYKFFGHEVFVV